MGLVAIGRLSLVREEETRAECVTPTCNLSARDKRYKCGNGGDERRIVRGKEQRDDKPQTLRPPRCASPFPCLRTRPGISRRASDPSLRSSWSSISRARAYCSHTGQQSQRTGPGGQRNRIGARLDGRHKHSRELGVCARSSLNRERGLFVAFQDGSAACASAILIT